MKVKRRQPLLLLLLLGFGKAFVSAAVASRLSPASHWLEESSAPSEDTKTLCRRGLNNANNAPMKRRIGWARLNEVMFGTENVVEDVISGFATRLPPASHLLEEYTAPSTDMKTLRRRGLNSNDPDPLKRKIDWARLNEVVFGTENVVEVITTGVATKFVVITGYLLAGESSLHSCYVM